LLTAALEFHSGAFLRHPSWRQHQPRAVVERNIDLAKLARRLEVLKPWEKAP